jgi:hypothetical protein
VIAPGGAGSGSPLDLGRVDFTDISPKYFHHLYTDITHEVLYNAVGVDR